MVETNFSYPPLLAGYTKRRAALAKSNKGIILVIDTATG